MSSGVGFFIGFLEMVLEETRDSESSQLSRIFREIQEKVDKTREKITEAARRAGRNPSDVLLVGVSKYAKPNDGVVEGLLRAGIFDLAENREKTFVEKATYWNVNDDNLTNSQRLDFRGKIKWHFIGAMQRNKVRKILPYTTLLHSIDSVKLLETVDRILGEEADSPSYPQSVAALLEVHISRDESKQGFAPDEIPNVLEIAQKYKRVNICGLMGMAGLNATCEETRRQFELLRKTLERCRELFPELTNFKELSMGMSGDYELAIEEGATIVRVGSALYPEKF